MKNDTILRLLEEAHEALLSQVDHHWRNYEEAETEYYYYFAGLFQPDGQEFGGF